MTKSEAISLVEKYINRQNASFFASKKVTYNNVYHYKSRLDELKIAINNSINHSFNLFTPTHSWTNFEIFKVKPLSYKVVEIPMTNQEIEDLMLVVIEDSIREFDAFFTIMYDSNKYERTRDDRDSQVGLAPLIIEKKSCKLYKMPSSIPPPRCIKDFIEFLKEGNYKLEWVGLEI
jgi:hypothetical protein